MKTTIILLLALINLSACGPHRMQCGPRKRCIVTAPQKNSGIQKTATTLFNI